MVVAARGGGSVLPVRSTKAILRDLVETAMPGVADGAASSMMVFHSPQVSQRPAHFGVTAPQDWQTKRAADLAMAEAPVVAGRSGANMVFRAAYV